MEEEKKNTLLRFQLHEGCGGEIAVAALEGGGQTRLICRRCFQLWGGNMGKKARNWVDEPSTWSAHTRRSGESIEEAAGRIAASRGQTLEGKGEKA